MVSGIPAGDRKIANLFYSVLLVLWTPVRSIFLPCNFISEHFFHPYKLIWNRHKILKFLIPHYEICENKNLYTSCKFCMYCVRVRAIFEAKSKNLFFANINHYQFESYKVLKIEGPCCALCKGGVYRLV